MQQLQLSRQHLKNQRLVLNLMSPQRACVWYNHPSTLFCSFHCSRTIKIHKYPCHHPDTKSHILHYQDFENGATSTCCPLAHETVTEAHDLIKFHVRITPVLTSKTLNALASEPEILGQQTLKTSKTPSWDYYWNARSCNESVHSMPEAYARRRKTKARTWLDWGRRHDKRSCQA